MEELHKAASAYYKLAPGNIQGLAKEFFDSMDTNGDGRVSRTEFVKFIRKSEYSYWMNSNLFKDLDRNGDRGLDFMEVMTLYYIIKTRTLRCDVCGMFITGLYFTCVDCFDKYPNTYNLCTDCVANKECGQDDHQLVDNYRMLMLKAEALAPPPVQQATTNARENTIDSPDSPDSPLAATPATSKLETTFRAFDTAIQACSVASTCTTM